jgi:hypothetical protein
MTSTISWIKLRNVMPLEKLGRKHAVKTLLAWILVFPFLAAWPFLSAFPAFSLTGSTTFDLSASLNVVFLLTGFWALASVYLMMWWMTNGKARSLYRSDKGLLLGAYATVWTGLYIIASMTSR